MADKPVVYTGRPVDSTAGTTIDIDFSSDLTLDHESEVPLLTLLSKLKDEAVLTHQFKFAVGRFAPRYDTATSQVSAGSVGASVTVPVTHPEYYLVGDIIEWPDTNNDATHINQGVITAISGSNLTVYPAYGVVATPTDPTTAGASQINSGVIVRVVASAMVEGSSGRPSRQTVPTVYFNYVQSFEDYFDVTRIQDKNRQYTHPERVRLREEVRKKHALDQEYALHLSHKAVDSTLLGSTGKPSYRMDGMLNQLKTNSLSYGGSLDNDELFGFMTNVHNPMYTGGNKRMVLASGDLMRQVNSLATPALRISTKETTWGPDITEVQFAGKVWQFIEAPALSDARAGWGEVLHPLYMKKRTFQSTIYEMNVQNPIDKFIKDGFYSVISMEQRLEEIGGIIKP